MTRLTSLTQYDVTHINRYTVTSSVCAKGVSIELGFMECLVYIFFLGFCWFFPVMKKSSTNCIVVYAIVKFDMKL